MSLSQFIRFSLLTDRLSKNRSASRCRVARWQSRRLSRLLRHAVANSPYYRDKFSGIDVGHAALSQLPTTTKQDLIANFDRTLTDRRIHADDLDAFMADESNLGHWYLGRYAVSHTSGSQGPPLRIVQDRGAIELLFAAMSARGSASRKPGLIEAVRRLACPIRVSIVTFRRGFYPSGASLEFMQQVVGPYVRVQRLSSTQDDLIEQLNDFQPHVLVGYASVLEAVALEAAELKLASLRQITNSSEQLTSRAKQRIETRLDAPVMDHYGLGECLLLSDGCAAGSIHINADWAILEVVDEHNQPIPAGTLGAKVLVTNLANRVQPFIRYEVGDRVALGTSPCSCGSRMPRIERIEGRSSEVFWVDEQGSRIIIPGVLFHTAIDSVGGIDEWQAVQLDREHVELRLQLAEPLLDSKQAAHQSLREKLHELGLPRSVRLDIYGVRKLSADPRTGKMRRMVSRIGARD